MSEGALEYRLINETKVSIDVSDIINKLARIVDDKLEDYWLYEEEPELSINDSGDCVEVYLRDNDSGINGSPCDWKNLFNEAIERLAKEIAEKGPEE